MSIDPLRLEGDIITAEYGHKGSVLAASQDEEVYDESELNRCTWVLESNLDSTLVV